MTPEISHRCPSCGASLRDLRGRVMFCPECGKALAEVAETSTRTEARSTSPAEVVEQPAAQPAVEKPSEPEAAEKTSKAARAANIVRHGGERTRETLHRASNVARGAIEDNVKRVEKIHHVSTVMFEEAHYDPSLRFVLVALGLFVVFVILLVLSKVMG